MYAWLKKLVTRATGAAEPAAQGTTRRVRVAGGGEPERDSFPLIVALMVTFFLGLVGLEVAHMLIFGAWNESVFNGVMLVVGTIVGAVYGRNTQ